jgi:formyl-CoA transferase
MYAGAAILAALRHAERTGEGQHVDVALFDCQIAMLANQASNYLVSGKAPGRLGNAHPNIAPYQVFPTADGHVVIAVGNDGQFEAFARAIGAPALAEDARFRTNRARVAERESLIAAIAPIMRTRTTTDWLRAMEEATVPAGPINRIDQVFAEPQAIARRMTAPVYRADAGAASMVPHPVKYSRTPAVADLPPPPFGSHTDEVLAEFASADELARLKEKGVVG